MNDFNGDIKVLFNGENCFGDVLYYNLLIVGNM